MRRVAIVAGEASGDQIGADLIAALRARHPGLDIFGMAGPRMRAAGCRALAEVDELAVMGLVEVLRHYPRLCRLRARLIAALIRARPDVLVGIDVPDFTLEIERRAKAAGIPAVHYVCPQVWAWRAGRLPAIREAVDLVLALFPFEVPFLADHGIEAAFVGHPLADRIPAEPDRAAARAAVLPDAAPAGGPLLAVLPGSRPQELARHAALFLDAALAFAARHPGTRIVFGALNAAAAAELEKRLAQRAPATGPAPLVVVGRASELLAAADVALLASGTVTLEAALSGTPAVVAYRLAPLSWWWLRRAVKVPHVALPNLLLGERLLPELLQDAATPAALADALDAWLAAPARIADYRRRCRALHASLAAGSGAAAAAAIERLVAARAGTA
ncbi:MAG TPA: lipid-A-disaccharide synthase [Gammaproteobacteria bacterium]|nr:lipid-A-disaccharide synthase [Gammaproteobacteria bacterium]